MLDAYDIIVSASLPISHSDTQSALGIMVVVNKPILLFKSGTFAVVSEPASTTLDRRNDYYGLQGKSSPECCVRMHQLISA